MKMCKKPRKNRSKFSLEMEISNLKEELKDCKEEKEAAEKLAGLK